jgi:hypothetical protein
MSTSTYIEKELTWRTPSDKERIPTPWKKLVFFSDREALRELKVGDILASFLSKNYPEGVGPGKIGAILYVQGGKEDGPIYTTEYSSLRSPIGFILIDESGEFILPILGATGEASFWIELTEDVDADVACFIKLVWEKQCEFAQCVQSYLTNMQFGSFSCEALEMLKNKRRALEILNCYDVRDIPNNTTDYNVLTYTQIKKLLNY